MAIAIEELTRAHTDETDAQAYRWTRAEFRHAAALGFFGGDHERELLCGEVYPKMTQNPPHFLAVHRTAEVLRTVCGGELVVRQQGPIAVGEQSEPEPDVAVIEGPNTEFTLDHPPASVVRLIIEVADTSLRTDRGLKAKIYAAGGIPDYWILNLNSRTLEVYRDPGLIPGDPDQIAYKTIRILTEAESIAPIATSHAMIRVSDLLPPEQPRIPLEESPEPIAILPQIGDRP